MLKIYRIPNAKRFIQLVQNSKGSIFLQMPDGTKCDLKNDSAALHMIGMMNVGKDGLELQFSEQGDRREFIQYME